MEQGIPFEKIDEMYSRNVAPRHFKKVARNGTPFREADLKYEKGMDAHMEEVIV